MTTCNKSNVKIMPYYNNNSNNKRGQPSVSLYLSAMLKQKC